MVTRFYLPDTGGAAAPISPAYAAAWHFTGSALGRLGTGTTKTNTSIGFIGSDKTGLATDPANALFRQYVSTTSIPSARTIAGTVSAVFAAVQAPSADAYLQMVIRVIASDGITVRGTLYAGQTGGEPSLTVGAQDEKMPTSTATRIWNAVALSSVAAQTGDYIVIELGARLATPLTNQDGNVKVGDPTAGADYALTSGLTTTLRPWIEFSDDLFTAGGSTLNATASLAVTNTLTATAAVTRPATASLAVTDTLTATATVTPTASASLAVTTSTVATAITVGVQNISASLALTTTVAATAEVLASSSAALSVTTTTAATAALEEPTAALAVTTTITASASLDSPVTTEADLIPLGDLELFAPVAGPTGIIVPIIPLGDLAQRGVRAFAPNVTDPDGDATIISRHRWIMYDPENGEQWEMTLNPDAMTTPFMPREAKTINGNFRGDPSRVRTIMSPPKPRPWEWQGVIRTEAHYNKLVHWANKDHFIEVTDHFDRTWRIMVEAFEPTDRRPTPNVPWRLRYTMKTIIFRRLA